MCVWLWVCVCEHKYVCICSPLRNGPPCRHPSRIRVLDEFDVFMDDTYRKIAVDTLLELCEKQPHRQCSYS